MKTIIRSILASLIEFMPLYQMQWKSKSNGHKYTSPYVTWKKWELEKQFHNPECIASHPEHAETWIERVR